MGARQKGEEGIRSLTPLLGLSAVPYGLRSHVEIKE
jgi:hypothetical protein